jgi:energy-coupling factor transport system ATP-binding protein
VIDTKIFSFILKYKSNNKTQSLSFPYGINIIYGESNVGKSELIKCLTNAESNSAIFDITDLSLIDNVQVIQQNPDLQIIGKKIYNELALNLEFRSNNSKKIQNELKEIINTLPYSVDLERHPFTLSGGEKEMLNISTTISLNPKVIFIDDALSFLNIEMKKIIVKQLSELNNTIILWFTSDYNDIKLGKTKWEMTSNEVSKIRKLAKFEFSLQKIKKGYFNLDISDLNFSYNKSNPIFNNYAITINNFRCLGIAGNNGTGKSTLASLLLKLEKPISGTIKLFSNEISNFEIGYLDQFPDKILGISTVSEFINKLIVNNKLHPTHLDKIKSDLIENNIDWEIIKEKTALELKWAQIRFILICILSNCNYDLLILDEPTFGLGNQQKLKLHSYFVRYLKKKHLILISHDKIFINSLCDSTIIL